MGKWREELPHYHLRNAKASFSSVFRFCVLNLCLRAYVNLGLTGSYKQVILRVVCRR